VGPDAVIEVIKTLGLELQIAASPRANTLLAVPRPGIAPPWKDMSEVVRALDVPVDQIPGLPSNPPEWKVPAPAPRPTSVPSVPLEQEDPDRGVTQSGSVRNAPKTEPRPRERLRYDGKTFAEWRDSLPTELNPDRLAQALRAMGTFGAQGYGAEAATIIMDFLRSRHIPGVDFDAARAKVRVRSYPDFAFELLEHYAADPNKVDAEERQKLSVFAAAFTALRDIGPPAVPVLMKSLAARDFLPRATAAHLLSESLCGEPISVPPALIPELLAKVRSHDPATRDAAVRVLASNLRSLKFRGENVKWLVPVLTQSLKNEKSWGPSARILASLGKPAAPAFPELLRKWQEWDTVKDTTDALLFQTDLAIALVKMSGGPNKLPTSVTTYLTKQLDWAESDEDATVPIAEALGELGPAAREALPALEEVASHAKTLSLRDAGTQAIKRIKQKGTR
jgi:hypothetical protein